MRVLIAFDKFKDALTAPEACSAAAAALRAKHPDWQLDLCPLTDGGEGFTEILCAGAGARLESIAVHGPREAAVDAPIGFVPAAAIPPAARERLATTGTLAVVGMAAASGLALLEPNLRDPWHTTTAGTGDLLRRAAEGKADGILLGVGGSATNDLGFGALAALGLRFIDAFGQTVDPTPARWHQIVRIEGRVSLPPIFIACDVTNPLLGQKGATVIFGAQKGLRPTDTLEVETRARRMAALLCDHCGQPSAIADTPGAGAAGGLPFGLMVAAGAKLVPGFDLVADWLDLATRIRAADLVLTGEGRFDATSLGGKGPGAIAAQARRLGKSAQVFAGSLGVEADSRHHAITPAGMPLAEALTRTAELLAATVGRVV
jgi:glycerate kinase